MKSKQPAGTLPAALAQRFQAIDAEIDDLKGELDLNHQRLEKIIPRQKQLLFNIENAGKAQIRDAVDKKLQEHSGEPLGKLLDRIFQARVGNQDMLQAELSARKIAAAKEIFEERNLQIKDRMTTLGKARKDLLAEHQARKIQSCVSDFGGKFGELTESYQRLIDAINEYRSCESDLPSRLRAMGINDPFLVELWGILGSRDLERKMLHTVNTLAGATTVPGNVFADSLTRTVTGQKVDGRFGLQRAFGIAKAG